MLGDFILNRYFKKFGLCCVCTLMIASVPGTVMAEETSRENKSNVAIVVPVETGILDTAAKNVKALDAAVVKVSDADVSEAADTEAADADTEAAGQAVESDTYTASEAEGEISVLTEEEEAELEEKAALKEEVAEETAEKATEETAEETAARESEERREDIVEYAKQFLGNRYVYGGTNPNKGVDCSGFTSYVMKHAGGVQLSHSSSAQSKEGKVISMEDARPGDLIFYGSGKHINHVALYIGDGEIVHASNERNGILISSYSYRKPVKIVNVLGD